MTTPPASRNGPEVAEFHTRHAATLAAIGAPFLLAAGLIEFFLFGKSSDPVMDLAKALAVTGLLLAAIARLCVRTGWVVRTSPSVLEVRRPRAGALRLAWEDVETVRLAGRGPFLRLVVVLSGRVSAQIAENPFAWRASHRGVRVELGLVRPGRAVLADHLRRHGAHPTRAQTAR